jgi:hypothetical protein
MRVQSDEAQCRTLVLLYLISLIPVQYRTLQQVQERFHRFPHQNTELDSPGQPDSSGETTCVCVLLSAHAATPATPLGRLRSWRGCPGEILRSTVQLAKVAKKLPEVLAINRTEQLAPSPILSCSASATCTTHTHPPPLPQGRTPRLYCGRVQHDAHGSSKRLRRQVLCELSPYRAARAVRPGYASPDCTELRAVLQGLRLVDVGNALHETAQPACDAGT